MKETEKSEINEMLRLLPKVDWLMSLSDFQVLCEQYSRELVLSHIRRHLDGLRNDILKQKLSLPDRKRINRNDLAREILERTKYSIQPNVKPVINAGGIILNTGLGRAVLSQDARNALMRVAEGFSSIEIDLKSGKRGNRHDLVEQYLIDLTGAEAAAVVNNNAAATLLALNTLAQNREVIISRGELVTIGGSFRIPEVMKRSGAIMREVGTTNHTKLFDYERAISEDTALLLKVHTSNYKIIGFTSETPLEDLVALGQKYNLPVMHDLGSGSLLDLSQFGLPREPVVGESIRTGADIVTFSGDKLLGGPQAGIIVGKKRFIQAIKENQLARALRCGKLTFAALEATLRLYFDRERLIREHPVLRMMTKSDREISRAAVRLRNGLNKIVHSRGEVIIEKGLSEVGGGSLATESLPTKLVCMKLISMSAEKFSQKLRLSNPPVITRIVNDYVAFDVRTVLDNELKQIVEVVAKILNEKN